MTAEKWNRMTWAEQQEHNRIFKTWHRALTGARRAALKKLEKMGYRPNVWTKTDKGRTITQVYGPNGAKFLSDIEAVLVEINAAWKSRLFLSVDHPHQVTIVHDEGHVDMIPGQTLYTIHLGR